MKNIQITVPYGAIKKELKKAITHPNKEIIVEGILGCLQELPVGLETLYLSFSGMRIEPLFKKGEKIITNWYNVSTWKFNKTNMINEGLILKNDMVEATVVGFNPFKSDNLSVDVVGRDDNNEIIIANCSFPQINAISTKEPFPFENEE
jgi:hypothetical protein